MSAIGLARLLADLACGNCGKATAVVNANIITDRRGFTPEKVTPDTHCTCPKAPASRPVS